MTKKQSLNVNFLPLLKVEDVVIESWFYSGAGDMLTLRAAVLTKRSPAGRVPILRRPACSHTRSPRPTPGLASVTPLCDEVF